MILGSPGALEVQPLVELRIRHLLVSGTSSSSPLPRIATMPPPRRGAKGFGVPELAPRPRFTKWALAEPPSRMYFPLFPSIPVSSILRITCFYLNFQARTHRRHQEERC